MRTRFVGYSGERPPVPGTEPVDPIDPNPDPPPDPDDPSIPDPLTLTLATGEFHKLDYLAMGYNRFDVMCIGAAGGNAGHVKQTIPDSAPHKQSPPFDYDLYFNSYVHFFGGGGGGGGVHRVKGRLALLPTIVPVVVGQAGADGAYSEVVAPFHHWSSGGTGEIPVTIPPGEDGEASSFGGTICRASGGKGAPGQGGGAGGIGNAELSGGGAAPGQNGPWDGVIGSGGGGGSGAKILAVNGTYASGGGSGTAGGDGAVSAADPTTKGLGRVSEGFGLDYTRVTSETVGGVLTGYNTLVGAHYEALNATGGAGGGAKPFLINGENAQYGSKTSSGLATTPHENGLVVIRLTYIIT
jgi:hypothetical protein